MALGSAVLSCKFHFLFLLTFQPCSLDMHSGWDIHDTVYSKELLISNKANGYRDVIAVIDLSSFRRIPLEHNVPFFLVFFLDPETKKPLSVDPRGVLQNVTQSAAQIGYSCFSGVEYEVRMDLITNNLLLIRWASTSISKVCISSLICRTMSILRTRCRRNPSFRFGEEFYKPTTFDTWKSVTFCFSMLADLTIDLQCMDTLFFEPN